VEVLFLARWDVADFAVQVSVVEPADGRSSAATKKADALRRIALAHRNYQTSRSSSTRHVESSVVTPRIGPSSTSARHTWPRSVSSLKPSCWAPHERCN